MTKKPRFQVKNLNLDCTLVLCLLELLVKVTSILTSTPSDSLTHPMTTVTSRSWCSNSRFHTGRGFLERSRSLNHPPVSFLGTSHSRTEAPLFAQDLDCRRRSFLTEPKSISSGAQPKRGVIKKPHGERTVWDQPIGRGSVYLRGWKCKCMYHTSRPNHHHPTPTPPPQKKKEHNRSLAQLNLVHFQPAPFSH